jgi:hypothetical protein
MCDSFRLTPSVPGSANIESAGLARVGQYAEAVHICRPGAVGEPMHVLVALAADEPHQQRLLYCCRVESVTDCQLLIIKVGPPAHPVKSHMLLQLEGSPN